MSSFSHAPTLCCIAAFAFAMPLLAGCGGPVQAAHMLRTENNIRRFRAATQEAIECRAAAARNPRYRILNQRMPLTDIGAASLSQMADPRFATKAEISALDAWITDLDACRQRLLQAADSTIPSLGPILQASWNQDEAVFVKLARHKLTWGDAVLDLNTNTTKPRADILSRADQITTELEKQEQAQISRRAAIMGSVIGKLP